MTVKLSAEQFAAAAIVFYALVGVAGNPGPAPLPGCRSLPPGQGERGTLPTWPYLAPGPPARVLFTSWLCLVWSFFFQCACIARIFLCSQLVAASLDGFFQNIHRSIPVYILSTEQTTSVPLPSIELYMF